MSHVGRPCTHGRATSKAMKSFVSPTVTMPIAPDHYVWDRQVQPIRQVHPRAKVEEGLSQSKWRSCEAPDFLTVSDMLNGVTSVNYQRHMLQQKNVAQSVFETASRFYSTKQHKHETTLTHYYKRYQNQLAVLEQCGGSVGADYGIQEFLFKEKGSMRQPLAPKRMQWCSRQHGSKCLPWD